MLFSFLVVENHFYTCIMLLHTDALLTARMKMRVSYENFRFHAYFIITHAGILIDLYFLNNYY